MKIAVCVKQTFDTEALIKLDGNGQVSKEGVNLIINPYDEYAIEEAVRIKEAQGGEVTVVSFGSSRADEALKQALAMGADKAILINCESSADESLVALALSKALADGDYDLVLGGYKAVDGGSAQVAIRLAELLNYPQATVVTKLEVKDGKVLAYREIDGGTEVMELTLPAVVTAQKGLNEPRYPSLKGIMKAKKKELKRIKLEDLGLSDFKLKVETLNYALPEIKTGGTILQGTPQETTSLLVGALRKEAKVI